MAPTTDAAPDVAPTPGTAPDSPAAGLGVPRIAVAGLCAAASIALYAAGNPGTVVLALLALLGAVAAAAAGSPASGRRSWVELLPVSLLGVLLTVAAAGAAAGFAAAATSPTVGRWILYASVAAILAAAVAVAVRRGGRIHLTGADKAAPVLLGASLVVAFAVYFARPFEQWVRFFYRGTDYGRNVMMLRDIYTDGGPDYITLFYPQGPQTLLSVLFAGLHDKTHAQAWAVLGLFFLLLVILTVYLLACSLVRFARLAFPSTAGHPVLGSVAVVALWATALSGYFLIHAQAGFLASLTGVFIVAVVAYHSYISAGASVRVPGAVALAGTAAMSFTWTLLIPFTAAAVAYFSIVGMWRARGHGPGRLARRAGTIAAAGLAAAAVAALPIVSLLRAAWYSDAVPADDSILATAGGDGFVSMLRTPGAAYLTTPGPVWQAVTAVAVAGAVWALWRRRAVGRVWLVQAGAGAAATAAYLALAGVESWDRIPYYPLKTLWVLYVYVLPAAAAAGLAAAVWVLGRIRRAQGRRKLVWVCAATAVAMFAPMLIAGPVAVGWRNSPPVDYVFPASSRNAVPYAVLVGDALATSNVLAEHGVTDLRNVAVWGIPPYGSADAGFFTRSIDDRLSYETLGWARNPLWPYFVDTPLARLTSVSQAPLLCAYLNARPEIVVLTGPNPASGREFLAGSGCTGDALNPDRWIPVQFDDKWFAGTPYEGQPYTYPTYGQVQDLLSGDWGPAS